MNGKEYSCFYKEYNDLTRNTSDLIDNPGQEQIFMTDSQTKDFTMMEGYFSSYNGEGYLLNLYQESL